MMRKRWRLQIGIRTLLFLVTVFGLCLGLHLRRTKLQQKGVAAIRDYGGWIRYDFQFPDGEYSYKGFDANAESKIPAYLLDRLGVDFFHRVVQVSLNYSNDNGGREENHNASDSALQHLECFPNLRVLLLSDTQATDESLMHVGKMTRLERVYMWDVTEVSDIGVAHFRHLKNLRYLHLSQSKITDKSLEVFAELPDLEGLSLQFNHFTDKGVQEVARLTGLESLWLCGRDDRNNPITDSGLARLHDLKQLTRLGIQNTEVTADGISAFQKAVPGCQIAH